ncbi:MAG: GNAT family N-acetyltransferase [Rhodobacterales bacterium]
MTLTHTPPTDVAAQAVQIVAFRTAHLPGALRLSQQAGWPHRMDDWGLNAAVSQGVAAVAGDRVVGTALCTVFGPVALLNMIIVDKAMRGQGLGRRLMEVAMAHAGPREMRLVATAEGIPLYEKLAFAACGMIRQHQGLAQSAAPALPVTSGGMEDIASLAVMDRNATGLERETVLRLVARQGKVLLAERGFALLRDFGSGRVVGPVVARDAETAKALIAEAARRTAGSFLRIDLPRAHGLDDFVTALGLAHVGGGTVMARNAVPAPQGDYTAFALASQALG